jgi:phage terminase large subunit GpA-like protein
MPHAITPQELQAAKPPERLTISQWACKYRELARDSAVTGLYTLELTPFFGPVMDACGSPDIDEVAVCACAQIGKTVALVENVSGYYCHQDPSGVFAILADEDTSKFVAQEKLCPMFRDSAGLHHLYSKKTFQNELITTPNGGRIDLGWASSVAKLASRPKRIVIADEVDKPGYFLTTGEASAISLLRERVKSYPQGFYKLIFLSTPTIAEGNIIPLLDDSDMIFDWHCKCPYCGQRQPLRWDAQYCHGFEKDGSIVLYRDEGGEMRQFGGVTWEGGREATKKQIKETAGYRCGDCGEIWSNLEKNQAVRDGKMVPRTETNGTERRVGYHVNRLYSLMDAGRIDSLVEEWIRINRLPTDRKPKELQGFVNSTLAEPWKTVVELTVSSEAEILKARVDLMPQIVPKEAVALTAFVDVQKYEFWFCVRAWANDWTSWMIDYGLLTSWEGVETVLFDRVYSIVGEDHGMRIWRAGVDTGGTGKYTDASMTEETYSWLLDVRGRPGPKIWPTKGASKMFPGSECLKVGSPLEKMPSGRPIYGGFRILSLDTHKLKNYFRARLKNACDGEGQRAAYLHSGVKEQYAKHILAEELRLDNRGNEQWVKVATRNDLLDCECGCLALAEPEMPGGGVNMIRGKALNPKMQRRGRRVYSRGV